MRTNIEIDDELMAQAMALTGLRTKREVVEDSLRTRIRLARQAKMRELRGSVEWEGNLAEMRASRFPDWQ